MADTKISEGGKNVYWSIKFCYVLRVWGYGDSHTATRRRCTGM